MVFTDIVGFASDGVYVGLSRGDGSFDSAYKAVEAFGVVAGNWANNDRYPRKLADINGDGRADIVGFGNVTYISLAKEDGTFDQNLKYYHDFTESYGWSNNNLYPRELADVNGDGYADIVGFASDGVYVGLSRGDGSFASAYKAVEAFGVVAGNWANNDRYPRKLGDVNGDGITDIVGFGNITYISLGKADGTFDQNLKYYHDFTESYGWSNDNLYPRELADINGDGFDDIVGFASDGVYVGLSRGDGSFASAYKAIEAFGVVAGNWANNDRYPRRLADINGDGKADIVGFGYYGAHSAIDGSFITTNNLLNGGDGDDRLFGSIGNDHLIGGIGDDYLEGDVGHDKLEGGLGNDWLHGGEGSDDIKGEDGNDTLYGGSGQDRMEGGEGADIIDGGNDDDTISGGFGEDYIQAGAGNDVVSGDAGNDTIFGGDGDDNLSGNDGTDRISGGDGNDVLNGGLGADLLRGGAGDDSFDFSSLEDSSISVTDSIEDFEQGSDKINLSKIEEDLSFESFEFVVENGHTIIKDKNSDFAIDLQGQFNMAEDDFNF